MNWVVVGAGLRYPPQQSSRPCSTLVTVEASRQGHREHSTLNLRKSCGLQLEYNIRTVGKKNQDSVLSRKRSGC